MQGTYFVVKNSPFYVPDAVLVKSYRFKMGLSFQVGDCLQAKYNIEEADRKSICF